jgi:hypothetical protein
MLTTTPSPDLDALGDGLDPRHVALLRQPSFSGQIGGRADRSLIYQLGAEALALEPELGFAFGGRVLERLRARIESATTDDERDRLRALDRKLSGVTASLDSVRMILTARGNVVRTLQAQRQAIDALLAHLGEVVESETATTQRSAA